MTAAPAAAGPALPRWLVWALPLALALPFHPLWVDFEQVRRGLLLVLTGVALIAARRLPPVGGERALWTLLGWFAVSAVIAGVGDAAVRAAGELATFQPWEAANRLLHYLALALLLRLGAAAPAAFRAPLTTLLATASAFGILQRLGVAEIAGYGVANEPVSVFGNLNVASEAIAVTAAAVAALGGARAWSGRVALLLAGAYLAIAGSRSGLIALPIGLGLLWLLERRRAAALPLLLAVLGGAAGYALDAGVPRGAPTDQAARVAAAARGTATLEVRFAIAEGALRLCAENPVFGHGPGQFAVQYPRVRSQAEIEVSSHGRAFATEVRTAHDDYLEVLVEGGVPALLGVFAVLWLLWRRCGERTRLVPLAVLLLLMLVRAPVGNAPAVAAALLLAGTARPTAMLAAATPRWRVALAWLLGLALVAAGLPPIVANTAIAPFQRALAQQRTPPLDAAATAAAWMPWEPRWLQLLGQEQLARGELAAAKVTAARALQLRPFDPQLHLLLGQVLANGTATREAAQIAAHGLQYDPGNPELRLLRATAQSQLGAVDEAIATLASDPPTVLRERLAGVFGDLAHLAEQSGRRPDAVRYAIEADSLAIADRLRDGSPGALAANNDLLRNLIQGLQEAGRERRDARGIVLGAAQALALGDRAAAEQLFVELQKRDLTLAGWQMRLLDPALQALRDLPGWRAVLAP